MKLGERIKFLRKEKSFTLDKLAGLSGVAKGTLSRIENGISTGNLNTHIKICEALRVNLGELYKDLDSARERIVTFPLKDGQDAEVFNYSERVHSVLLAKHTRKNKMLPQILLIEGQKDTPTEENPPSTDKFFYCLEGEVEVTIAEKKYTLKKNGSIYFDSSLPHSVKNPGQETAKLLTVVSPVAL